VIALFGVVILPVSVDAVVVAAAEDERAGC